MTTNFNLRIHFDFNKLELIDCFHYLNLMDCFRDLNLTGIDFNQNWSLDYLGFNQNDLNYQNMILSDLSIDLGGLDVHH